jgi:hypothetical protein
MSVLLADILRFLEECPIFTGLVPPVLVPIAIEVPYIAISDT